MINRNGQINSDRCFIKGENVMPAKIRKRSNGTYQLAVSYGSKDDGSQQIHYKTINAQSKAEAAREWIKFANEVQSCKLI